MSTDELRTLNEIQTEESAPAAIDGNDRPADTLYDLVKSIHDRQARMELELRSLAADIAVIRSETQKNSRLRNVLATLTQKSDGGG